jgi:F0F1-type ATP synthase assembly protein I
MAGAAQGSGIAMGILNSMIAGMLLWAGIGWLLDLWWGTRFMAGIGAVLGLGFAIYLVITKFSTPDRVDHPVTGTDSRNGLADGGQIQKGDPATGSHRKGTE